MAEMVSVHCGNCGAELCFTDSDHDLCASAIGLYCLECAAAVKREEEEEVAAAVGNAAPSKRMSYCADCGEYREMEQGKLCAKCYAEHTGPVAVCPSCLADVPRADLAQSSVEGVLTCTACRLREAAASSKGNFGPADYAAALERCKGCMTSTPCATCPDRMQ